MLVSKRLVFSALVSAALLAGSAGTALGQSDQGIGVFGPEGWTVLRPSVDTKFIFVSSSEGNDANDGLTPETPKRTIDQARRQVRPGYPDWVLLKRGDSWEEEFRWYGSGRSMAEPQVIAAYGEGSERPVVTPPIDKGGFYIGTPSQNYLAITGIEFRAAGLNSQTGIRIIADTGEGVLIEDCHVEGFKDNITFIGKDSLGGFTDLQIRRSVIVDATPGGTAHSQGIYCSAVDDILIEGCVLDHNGWNGTTAPATMFNHNIYIQSDCGPATVRENIIAMGSSHGLQARGGGTIDDNLFLNNALALFVAQNDSTIKNNVILGARDINAANPRGFGIEVLPVPEGLVQNNIIAHRDLASAYGYAIQLSTGEWGPSDMSVTVEKNIVFNWPDRAFRAYRSNESVYRDIVVRNNDFQDQGSQTQLIDLATASLNLTRWEFSGNRYHTGKAVNSWFRVGAGSGDISWWQSRSEEWTGQVREVSYPDPDRSVASYWASLGNTGGYDGFMQRAREQSRANWDSRVTAPAVNDYVRQGFGLPEAP